LPCIEAYILGGDERLDADLIGIAERLTIISFVGTGYRDFIDEDAARAKGISIFNTPAVATLAVAEHTIGLALGLARGLFAQNAAVKHSGIGQPTTREIGEMLVGIIGMGAVGTRVARILRSAFGCTLYYTSRTRKPELEVELEMMFVDLDALFSKCDLIILLASTTTKDELVTEARLSLARPGLLLINTANPRLVSPEALKLAIASGQVAAAAFDGYWIEPLPAPDVDPHGLLRLPDRQFVITPHTAAKTRGTWERMVTLAVDNVTRYIEGSTR
jgi:lactate dehydrogenase-like 2-hydroxyacid dehydrogenase